MTFDGKDRIYYTRGTSQIEMENLLLGNSLPGTTVGVATADLRIKNHFFL